jgi:TonB-dependent receptor
MARSLEDKKLGNSISDSISAEDLGKFPDQNVAESLQRITGVSIDRNGGEGQFVTVRGFGPQFNTVLVNGRQMATENEGREFSFDTLPAELISGAAVFKSPTADMQEGGIGATVNVTTARPFDLDGFKIAASAKGVYDDLAEEMSPQISGLISNTFNDDTMGILFAVSYQERQSQNNMLETRYWRPNVSFASRSGAEYNNIYVPQNFDQIVDLSDRTRTSANLVFQAAPSEELTLTFDGLVSKFEVESDAHSVGHWVSDSNLDSVTLGANNSVNSLTSTVVDNVGGATDFIRRAFGRDVDISAFGINADWDITDSFKANFDISTSTAKENSGGKINFNVIGYNNAYTTTYDGNSPTIDIVGGEQALLDPTLGLAHYNEKGGLDTEDKITEVRADFEWTPESDTFTQLKYGLYYQDRSKDNVQRFSTTCNVYCGYGVSVPDDLMTQFTPTSFFPGVPGTWLTYDTAAYEAFMASPEALAAAGSTAAEYAAFSFDNPPATANSYKVEEEVLSAYIQFSFSGELGDMGWDVNAGARYSETNSEVFGTTRILLDLQPILNDPSDLNEIYAPNDQGTLISEANDYSNLLPNINVKLEVDEDMLVRFAYSQTMTRPTMSSLVPVFNVTSSRPNNNQAQAGNAGLKPFLSKNWDISYEWYYGDTSYFAAAVFSKEVDDFIVNTVETESLSLVSGAYDFDIRRPRNGEVANVNGLEISWSHVLENGFGFQVNATKVDSDAEVGNDTNEIFALEGLGDSQNMVLFYEKDGLQARIAFNNREAFLQDIVSPLGGTEPRFTETYGQWDISASYEIDQNWTVFFEGINITGEELRRHGRFKEQFVQLVDNGSRYGFGVRASF